MVAWEQQLEERSVPAWRDNYITYARLKRKLDRLKSAASPVGKEHSADIRARLLPAASFLEKLPSQDDILGNQVLPEHEDFLKEVEFDLDRVARFYSEMVTALESRVRRLVEDGEAFAGAAGLRSGLGQGGSRGGLEEISELHLQAIRLTDFALVNGEAFRKIVKKMDKQCGTALQKVFVDTRLKTSALADPGFGKGKGTMCNGERARVCRRELEQLVSPEILEILENKAMQATLAASQTHGKKSMRRRRVLLSAVLAVVATFLAGFWLPHSKPEARRCVALVVFTVSMWVSEAVPFEATALFIAPLAVMLSVLQGERKDQAKKILAVIFNDSLFLVLSGFVMSSVFSRCQLDCRAAARLQKKLGDRPFMFLLAIMFLGTGLSALLSNVTAPLLLLGVLKPLIRDIPTDSRYSRALLLGLAFSCNIGGMITPISSPQNVAALQTLRQEGGSVTWAQWLSLSIPFCALMNLVGWSLLRIIYQFDRSENEAKLDEDHSKSGREFKIPAVVFESEEMTVYSLLALGCACLTLCIYAYAPAAECFGGTPSVAVLFVSIMLGTGVISRQTFNSYSWHLLFLIGGGSALGLAVRESGLLDVLTHFAKKGFADTPWILIAELVLVLVAATTFVSHTVAALVLMPLVVKLGQDAGVGDLAVLVGALSCSAACALPMTSFPNVNSLMAADDHGRPWLSVRHFLVAGIPMTLLTAGLLVGVGYPLAELAMQP